MRAATDVEFVVKATSDHDEEQHQDRAAEQERPPQAAGREVAETREDGVEQEEARRVRRGVAGRA